MTLTNIQNAISKTQNHLHDFGANLPIIAPSTRICQTPIFSAANGDTNAEFQTPNQVKTVK